MLGVTPAVKASATIEALATLKDKVFLPDREIIIACYLNREFIKNGLIDPQRQVLPDLSVGFKDYIESWTKILNEHDRGTINEGTDYNNKQGKIVSDLNNLSYSDDNSIFNLGPVVNVLADLSDLIPGWMSSNMARELCESLSRIVNELEIILDLLNEDSSDKFTSVRNKLSSDRCQEKISLKTIKEFNKSISPILTNLSQKKEIGLLQLLEMAIAPVERWLEATRGELGLIKQACSDQERVSDPTMSLLFPPKISELFTDISKFLEKHLNLSEQACAIQAKDKVFILTRSLKDSLEKLGKEAPLGEIKLALAANDLAKLILGEKFKTFYQWKAYKRDDSNTIFSDRIELPNEMRFQLNDEVIFNHLAPSQDYSPISGGWIMEPAVQSREDASVSARVKTNQSLSDKILSVLLDNYSRKHFSGGYAVTIGKKQVQARSWICDQYGIMIVAPSADELINLIHGKINGGELKGVESLRVEKTTAKNGFVTRKLTVKFTGEQASDTAQNKVRKVREAKKDSMHQNTPPIIIEIQFRTPAENEAAEKHPELAHDVYKKKVKDRLNDLRSANPAIDFIAHLIQWAINGAEGEPPNKIRGYSCEVVG